VAIDGPPPGPVAGMRRMDAPVGTGTGASHGIRSLTEPGFQTLFSLSFQSSLQGSLTVLLRYR